MAPDWGCCKYEVRLGGVGCGVWELGWGEFGVCYGYVKLTSKRVMPVFGSWMAGTRPLGLMLRYGSSLSSAKVLTSLV